MEKTNIEITTSTWRELNSRKSAPSESFDDVITRLLEQAGDDPDAPGEKSSDSVAEVAASGVQQVKEQAEELDQ